MPLIGSKDAKFEDAAELYQKAGNAFKVAKNFEEAGAAFKNAAGCYQKIGSQHEAATAFQEAGNAYKKVNTAEAVAMLKLTIELLSDLGRFSQVCVGALGCRPCRRAWRSARLRAKAAS